MFSSKVIKIKDKHTSEVHQFLLKQFPSDDTSAASDHSDVIVKQVLEKKEADTLHDMRLHAQQDAQLTIAHAQKEAQRIEREAYERGFSKGEHAGMQKAEAELAPLIAFSRGMCDEFKKIKEYFYIDHQDIILELALKIARKVIHQEIVSNNELIIGVLSSAIKLAIDREKLLIRIHPDDLEICQQKRPDIMKNSDGIKQILFEPDGSVDKGGAIIEYAFGEIDARIEQQFTEIERELKNTHLDMDEML
ncbi:MAG: FliH/SctL family protein [Pseudomonadota bacterium]